MDFDLNNALHKFAPTRANGMLLILLPNFGAQNCLMNWSAHSTATFTGNMVSNSAREGLMPVGTIGTLK